MQSFDQSVTQLCHEGWKACACITRAFPSKLGPYPVHTFETKRSLPPPDTWTPSAVLQLDLSARAQALGEGHLHPREGQRRQRPQRKTEPTGGLQLLGAAETWGRAVDPTVSARKMEDSAPTTQPNTQRQQTHQVETLKGAHQGCWWSLVEQSGPHDLAARVFGVPQPCMRGYCWQATSCMDNLVAGACSSPQRMRAL